VSLVGIPPLAGFIGKFAVFAALVDAGGPIMISLLVIAGLNTVISLIYYLRVAKVVSIDPEPETRGPITLGILPTAYVLIVAIPVLYYGLRPAWILEIAHQATQQLFL
jgi:NADH-quinone oxidoreductase subunit N